MSDEYDPNAAAEAPEAGAPVAEPGNDPPDQASPTGGAGDGEPGAGVGNGEQGDDGEVTSAAVPEGTVETQRGDEAVSGADALPAVEGDGDGQSDDPGEEEEAEHPVVACCHFSVGGVEFHIPTASLVEIAENQRITPVPLAPAYVAGVASIHGRVVPVVDLGVIRQGGERLPGDRRLVVAEAGGEMLAFSVDGMPDLSYELVGEAVDVRELINSYRVVMH